MTTLSCWSTSRSQVQVRADPCWASIHQKYNIVQYVRPQRCHHAGKAEWEALDIPVSSIGCGVVRYDPTGAEPIRTAAWKARGTYRLISNPVQGRSHMDSRRKSPVPRHTNTKHATTLADHSAAPHCNTSGYVRSARDPSAAHKNDRHRPATRQDTDGTIRLGGEVRAAREHTNNARLACADTSNRVGTIQSSGSQCCDLMRPYPSAQETEHLDKWIQTVAGTEAKTPEHSAAFVVCFILFEESRWSLSGF